MDVEIENYMKTLNLDEICRTCLSECDEMTSVFTEIEPTDEDDISYVYQVLMNVASIQVMFDDGLPTLICKNCVENANNAFKFKVLCERSEALLQTYLTNSAENKNEESTEYDVQYEENPEETDHNYVAENGSETTTESNEQEVVAETVKDEHVLRIKVLKSDSVMVPTTNTNFEEDEDETIEHLEDETIEHLEDETIVEHLEDETIVEHLEDETIVEHLEDEFQTDEHEESRLKQLLNEDSPQKVDLSSVKIEYFNCDEPSIQELVVKPDIYTDLSRTFSEDSFRDTSIVASSDESILLRDKKLKVSKPRKKRTNYYPTKINEDGEKMYICTYCEKEYKHSTSLKVHIRSHTLERPYVCKLCFKGFKQLTALTYHMRTHTGETPYKCTLCDKRYRQSASLTAHMRVHTGQRPFLCSVCGKGFRQAPDLGYHMRTHTKEKPYMCSVCGKRMSMQCHLVQHMRTHTGERPFSCKECGKSFPSNTRLKRHEIIHTDLKPFECEVCNKSFNRASTLKVHAMTHSEEKPHVCKICGKGFIQQHCLRSHMRTHCTFDFFKSELPGS